MTAATSPRLGLMLPTNTDNFGPTDFVDTFTKLDQRPGILPVANYAALPTGLTSAQHGSCYLQLDNGSLWMWNRPGAAAGIWKKLNTAGQLLYASQASTVSTATTDETAGPAMINTTFVAPGGRNMMAFFSHYSVQNSAAYGASRVSMWYDGAVCERSYQYSGKPNSGVSHRLLQGIGAGTPGSTHTLKVTISSVSFAGAGTTTANSSGQLYVWEM